MRSSSHIDNKKKDILVLGKGLYPRSNKKHFSSFLQGFQLPEIVSQTVLTVHL